jgi:hypothetical protein
VTRWAGVRTPLLAAGAVGALSMALHLRDPHESGTWGYCPWLLLTGRYCPGCGALRAVNDLTRGDLLGAASSNLLLVLAIPLVVWGWARWTRASWEGTSTTMPAWVRAHPRVVYAGAALVALVFTVLRNLPGSWLAP